MNSPTQPSLTPQMKWGVKLDRHSRHSTIHGLLLRLCPALLLLASCREEPGACSGKADRLCIEATLAAGVTVPDEIDVSATADTADNKQLTGKLTAGVSSAFSARGKYVLELDVSPVSDAQNISVHLDALQSSTALAKGDGAWQRQGGAMPLRIQLSSPIVNVDMTSPVDQQDLSVPMDLTGADLTAQQDLRPAGPAWMKGMAATATIGTGLLKRPTDVCWSGSRLYVSDRDHHRVVVFDKLDGTATLLAAIGRPDTSTPVSLTPLPTTGQTMNSPTGLWCDASRLVVADTSNHRVLYFTGTPGTNASANGIAGQANGTGNMANRNAAPDKNTLNGPQGVFVDGNRLYIADRGNNRVVGYVSNDFTSLAGQNASILFGQGNDFTASTLGSGPANLNRPEGVTVADGRLAVVDSQNNRVIVFDIPAGTGNMGNAALGQTNLSNSMAGSTPATLYSPSVARSFGGQTFVADRLNSRVLIYPQGLPATGSFAVPATIVLGQPDFMAPPATALSGPSDLNRPAGLYITMLGTDTVIIVADTENNRVQIFRAM